MVLSGFKSARRRAMKTSRMVVSALALVGIYIFVMSLPDVTRYLKMRTM
jgi:hypothetical protein